LIGNCKLIIENFNLILKQTAITPNNGLFLWLAPVFFDVWRRFRYIAGQ